MTNHRQALAHGIPVLQDREDVNFHDPSITDPMPHAEAALLKATEDFEQALQEFGVYASSATGTWSRIIGVKRPPLKHRGENLVAYLADKTRNFTSRKDLFWGVDWDQQDETYGNPVLEAVYELLSARILLVLLKDRKIKSR